MGGWRRKEDGAWRVEGDDGWEKGKGRLKMSWMVVI
jgi:hypothetical protein